jgi:hypothetical protein
MPRKYKRFIPFKKGPIEVISEKDRIGNHLSNIMIHVLFLLISCVIIFPIISFTFLEADAQLISVILFIIASPMFKLAFQNRHEISIYNLKNSIIYVFKNHIIQTISLSFLNIYLLLAIGFQTLIPTNVLIIVYILISIVALFVFKSFDKKYFKSFVLTPLVFNVLLLTNYLISFNEKNEFYTFNKNFETVFNQNRPSRGSQIQQSTLITLKDNAYDNYYGIRVFLNIDEVKNSIGVRYTFKTGIFGVRVLTNHSFY